MKYLTTLDERDNESVEEFDEPGGFAEIAQHLAEQLTPTHEKAIEVALGLNFHAVRAMSVGWDATLRWYTLPLYAADCKEAIGLLRWRLDGLYRLEGKRGLGLPRALISGPRRSLSCRRLHVCFCPCGMLTCLAAGVIAVFQFPVTGGKVELMTLVRRRKPKTVSFFRPLQFETRVLAGTLAAACPQTPIVRPLHSRLNFIDNTQVTTN